ncbi:PD-(D/E)XK nuclease superfamily protein [Magnetospirillum sp. UT-4]|uniref:PD-(D/E)XK nuclease superfamily protein n=1 Tax=Magnetospirillum sp. UT-4 TaxID=2681467 RepID=UPI0013829E92|nr:PD-(D/E)XK nuclease superfamily protein [Magnetospirillum sp. UT-4]CAA7616939.1 putative Site-specific DNA methylase [Magnetospirillum sp. UT-4]
MRPFLARLACAVAVSACLWAAPAAWAWQGEADSQGQEANWSGQDFERRIRRVLIDRGFAALTFAEWRSRGEPGGDWILANAPFTTLYGGPGRTEFLVLSDRLGLEIRIEAKYMAATGSVDEKLPYVYLSAVEAARERTVFVIIDGPGWRPGSVEWLRTAAAERRYGMPADKELRVLSLAEFTAWAEGLPKP